eukprot:11218666-Lingulodinium_polyedra.AAC.1
MSVTKTRSRRGRWTQILAATDDVRKKGPASPRQGPRSPKRGAPIPDAEAVVTTAGSSMPD